MRRVWIALAGLVSLAGLVFWIGRPNDEAQIRGQLARLAASLHKTADGSPVMRVARLRGDFADILDESPHVTIPDLPAALPDDRRGLADSAMEITALVQTLDLEFSELDIKIDDAHTAARVNLTATLTAEGERERRAIRPVTFLLWKRDGTWRISAVTVWAEEERTG